MVVLTCKAMSWLSENWPACRAFRADWTVWKAAVLALDSCCSHDLSAAVLAFNSCCSHDLSTAVLELDSLCSCDLTADNSWALVSSSLLTTASPPAAFSWCCLLLMSCLTGSCSCGVLGLRSSFGLLLAAGGLEGNSSPDPPLLLGEKHRLKQ